MSSLQEIGAKGTGVDGKKGEERAAQHSESEASCVILKSRVCAKVLGGKSLLAVSSSLYN